MISSFLAFRHIPLLTFSVTTLDINSHFDRISENFITPINYYILALLTQLTLLSNILDVDYFVDSVPSNFSPDCI